jgi:uncharacterized protein
MAAFLGILFLVFAWLGHVVLWVGIVNRLHANRWPRKLVDLLTFVSGVMLLALAWPLLLVSTRYIALPYLSENDFAPGSFSLAYAWLSAGVGVLGIGSRLYFAFHSELSGVVRASRSRPIPLGNRPDDLLAPGLPRLLGKLPGNQIVSPELNEKELAIPQLATNFAGLRIAHLSDLHLSGRVTRGYLDAIVDETNKLEADLIVVTGDIVEQSKCLDWVDESLSQLAARSAKLFVLGNHDRRVGPDNVRKRMCAAGFIDAGSRCQRLDLPQGPCWVAGNETPWFGEAPPIPWVDEQTPDPRALRLALIHTPDLIDWCAAVRFHLALAGHNHGGQIRMPLLGAIVSPSRYGTRYASGTFRRGETVLHVSQGTSCLAPLRFNCPPELALLTLVQG